MSTSTLSQDSSTLSTECDLDAFSFDSETSVDASPNDAGKVNESVKKEVNEKKKETYGVVALRNPKYCCDLHAFSYNQRVAAQGVSRNSNTNGSLDKHTPSAPSSAFSDSLKRLRTMAGIIKDSPKDAPSVKRINMNANFKAASATKAVKVGKPLQRMRSSRSATSVVSTRSKKLLLACKL
ncbi:hypothetical protein KIN20_025436 [Parelaphostrongylus tenuis]|uniref:Uncharacterized protein n=1 Tax=Parelaphostrongylus tenuis TaxID=148309 RepID=A0AAD5QWX9_PARTN|nr:hypothetical protein KIN20_025436 [Parelaphostrongylus tenuis]